MRKNFAQRREIHASLKGRTADLLANCAGTNNAKASFVKAKVLILFLALAGLLPMVAQAQVNYAVSGNTAYVTYSLASGSITIASTYDGYPVTSIGAGAFSFCTSLINIDIPNSVTNIGNGAFSNCYGLTSIIIPDSVISIGSEALADCHSLTSILIPNSVTSIGYWAFAGCTSLTNVTIPNNVTNISAGAFQGCASLTNIVVTSDNLAYSSANGVLFNKSQTTIVEFPRGYAGSYTIPDSVTNIGNYAFSGCANLTGVTIPNNVKNISEAAFFLCVGLTNVVIGTNVTSIGIGVFENCTSLTSISIPNSVTNIGMIAFQSSGLTSITIPSSIGSIGESAFTYCTSLTNLTFLGKAPILTSGIFYENAATATVYYYYGTSGWGATYGGLPTVELAWTPQIVGSAKMQSDGFDFTIIGTNGMPFVVEASTNLVDWQPVWTNILSGASTAFTDSQRTNYPVRFYRAR